MRESQEVTRVYYCFPNSASTAPLTGQRTAIPTFSSLTPSTLPTCFYAVPSEGTSSIGLHAARPFVCSTLFSITKGLFSLLIFSPLSLSALLPSPPIRPSTLITIVEMPHYSEKKHLYPMQGGCACGATRYQLSLPPILVHCCHCLDCQRQTGSAFAINAVVESSAVSLLPSSASPGNPMPVFARLCSASIPAQKEDQEGTQVICLPSKSGVGSSQVQCPKCHTTLWNHYADGTPSAYLRTGTLDNPEEIEPDVHIFTRSKRSFISISDDKPQFEGYYGDRKPFYREDVMERVEALRPLMAKWREEFQAALTSGS